MSPDLRAENGASQLVSATHAIPSWTLSGKSTHRSCAMNRNADYTPWRVFFLNRKGRNSETFRCLLQSLVRPPLMMILLWGSLPLCAQQKGATQVQLEDAELYYAFLRAHTDTDLKIQASAPAAATSLSTSTAALYNISASDLPKLTAEVRKFNVNLGAWYLAQQNYLYQQKVAKKKPDPKVLVNNQWQRQRLVMNAHAGIRGAIQRSSWAGLHSYITGAFATSLQQAKGAAQ